MHLLFDLLLSTTFNILFILFNHVSAHAQSINNDHSSFFKFILYQKYSIDLLLAILV